MRTGVAVAAHRCNVLEEDGGVSLLDTLDPLPDVAVCVIGLLGDQAENQRDSVAAERVMRTNYVSPALPMEALAERFEQRGGGVLVGVNSVAGEWGWASNYVYGPARARFTAFLSGLRSRLAALAFPPNTSLPCQFDNRKLRTPRDCQFLINLSVA